MSRRTYFTGKGLHPHLLSTYFFAIDEEVRLPLAKALLPFVADKTGRGILQLAIENQPEQWEPLDLDKSSWSHFRQAGIRGTQDQQFEDLMQLQYNHLLRGAAIPSNANLTLFWGGLCEVGCQ